jgi:hypothetical protein
MSPHRPSLAKFQRFPAIILSVFIALAMATGGTLFYRHELFRLVFRVAARVT